MTYAYGTTKKNCQDQSALTYIRTTKNILAVIGVAIAVTGIKLFIEPVGINIGGFAGMYAIMYTYFGVPNILSALILNLLPFLWALKRKGVATIIRTVIVTAIFSILLDLSPKFILPFVSQCLPLAVVTGAVLSGAGFGLILISDASTGGSVFLGLMVHDIIPFIPVGVAMTLVNGGIVVITGILCGMTQFAWSLVGMAIVNLTIGAIVDLHGTHNKHVREPR